MANFTFLANFRFLTLPVDYSGFFSHFQFPPYATNETGRLGAVGRRELGHGEYYCFIPSKFYLKLHVPY